MSVDGALGVDLLSHLNLGLFAARTFRLSLLGLGRADKRDSQTPHVLIQDCFLRNSHGSRGLVGCGVGADRAAFAA